MRLQTNENELKIFISVRIHTILQSVNADDADRASGSAFLAVPNENEKTSHACMELH